MGTALLLVDLQNDFFPGGALPTPEGDQVLEPIKRLIERFDRQSLPIYATRDWHPRNHCSFQEQGGIWPPHCVQKTPGADFNSQLVLPDDTTIISKADSPDKDAYSGFEGTELANLLKQRHVSEVVVAGLATDYCVKNTVLDALGEGFEVTVVREAISGVEVHPGDTEKAIGEMTDHGARIEGINDLSI